MAFKGSKLISRVMFLCLCLALPWVQQPGFAQTPASTAEFGTYHALIIGINDYEHWDDLDFAETDAREIRDILMTSYGFEPENVFSLFGAEANESAIRKEINSLLGVLGPSDNLLIYYAGHGQLEPLVDTGYCIPVGGKRNDDSTWISSLF